MRNEGKSIMLAVEHPLEYVVALIIKALRNICTGCKPVEAVVCAWIYMEFRGDTGRKQTPRVSEVLVQE
jgi:hypothetical protein